MKFKKCRNGKDIYVHYHDSVCLYESGNNKLVDVEWAYNQPLDLNTLVTVCTTTTNNHVNHKELKNYADYGLEFRFSLATENICKEIVIQTNRNLLRF